MIIYMARYTLIMMMMKMVNTTQNAQLVKRNRFENQREKDIITVQDETLSTRYYSARTL